MVEKDPPLNLKLLVEMMSNYSFHQTVIHLHLDLNLCWDHRQPGSRAL